MAIGDGGFLVGAGDWGIPMTDVFFYKESVNKTLSVDELHIGTCFDGHLWVEAVKVGDEVHYQTSCPQCRVQRLRNAIHTATQPLPK